MLVVATGIFSSRALAQDQGVAKQHDGYVELRIKAVDNRTSESLVVSQDGMQEKVSSQLARAFLLHKIFKVPFVSIRGYREQFMRDVPYVPTQAIRVRTHQGLFGIWESEMGVVYAPDPTSFDPVTGEWVVKPLFGMTNKRPHEQYKVPFCILNLLLRVSEEGDFSLVHLPE